MDEDEDCQLVDGDVGGNLQGESVKVQQNVPFILETNYSIMSNLGNGNVVVKCKLCSAKVKGNVSSTGNFRSHMKVINLLYSEAQLHSQKIIKSSSNFFIRKLLF